MSLLRSFRSGEEKCPMQHELHEAIIRSETSYGGTTTSGSRQYEERFVPIGCLEQVCTEEKVKKELLGQWPEAHSLRLKRLTRYVVREGGRPGNGIKVFAVLVYIGYLSKLEHFIDDEILDTHLPLGPGNNDHHQARYLQEPQVPAHFRDCFYKEQWLFLAPYIKKYQDSTSIEKFQEATAMPWTAKMPLGSRQGGFSKVHCVSMHTAHYDTTCGITKFALKTLNSKEIKEFAKELKGLERCWGKKHLVSFYTAFQCGDEFSFLFPWAEGRSLKDLWRQERPWLFQPPRERSRSTREWVLWIAEQCCGLAGPDGLLFIHDTVNGARRRKNLQENGDGRQDYYGIHGDIKPHNILHFSQESAKDGRGVLKISDMGLTGFHTEQSRSLQPLGGPCSQTYRAPEYSLEQGLDKLYLTRKYDIWGLGCVFSELLSWFLLGSNGVDNYEWDRYIDPDDGESAQRLPWNEDRFFKQWREGKKVVKVETKPSVISWIENLCSIAGKDNFVSDFLVFIKDQMLKAESKTRADGKDVYNFLKSGYERCKAEESYCFSKYLSPDVEKYQALVDFERQIEHLGTSSESEIDDSVPSIEVTDSVDDGPG